MLLLLLRCRRRWLRICGPPAGPVANRPVTTGALTQATLLLLLLLLLWSDRVTIRALSGVKGQRRRLLDLPLLRR